MKRVLNFSFALSLAMILLASCSSSKNASTSNNVSRKDLKGTWVVTSTSVEGTDPKGVKITAFDDAALSCFNGSTWTFPNSNYGSYTLNSPACGSGPREIIWSQSKKDGATYLNFKFVDGLKRNQSKNVAEGYSLQITSEYDKSFTAKSPVYFDGKTIYIVYNFEKQ